jgi:5-deoxy-glucuronate isomerase
MHIAPHDNQNNAIVDADDPTVPLNYFNIVNLKAGEAFEYQVPGYETCIVPATGTVDVSVEGVAFDGLGNRTADVWDGEPEGVYVPCGAKVTIVATRDTETFVAGAKYDKVLDPFDVRVAELDKVQYGSDDTKTHRKIKHILGQKSCSQLAKAAGQVFPHTSMTRTTCPMRPATMRPTISGSNPTTVLACRSFNAKRANRGMPIN